MGLGHVPKRRRQGVMYFRAPTGSLRSRELLRPIREMMRTPSRSLPTVGWLRLRANWLLRDDNFARRDAGHRQVRSRLTRIRTSGLHEGSKGEMASWAIRGPGIWMSESNRAWMLADAIVSRLYPLSEHCTEATQASLCSVVRGGHRHGLLRTPSE